MLQRVDHIWPEARCIIAATGPSLTEAVAEQCRGAHAEGFKVIAVNDAWRLMPWADALYACDRAWWKHHQGTNFLGAKWSSHHKDGNDKLDVAAEYGLRLVGGAGARGFSFNPEVIHYGGNSGFQAVNLALLFGCTFIVLVGFNMQRVDGKAHFFGDHPGRLQRAVKYERFCLPFDQAARDLPRHIRIVNATPKSALTCFRAVELSEVLESKQLKTKAA